MKIGLIEPHLRCYGGIRRVLEFSNRLVARGHSVTFFLPDGEPLACDWMDCAADIRPMSTAADAVLDVVLFNHEPQWHLLDHFTSARRRVFYALHYSRLYGKESSWEALRAEVDHQFANSNWTADRIAEETGHRPTVQVGGANRSMFHPTDVPKGYPVLCVGGDVWRPWKGTDTISEACELLGVPLEQYGPKGLPQSELGREYQRAEVFAVGSWFEGFCQPGLEALACGVPLVTTANGGCAEYALHEETALVVEPRDPAAMAEAIRRLRSDTELAERLVAAGLETVREEFDWEQRTDEFAERLDGIIADPGPPPPRRPAPPAEPELSIVTLAWDNLDLTQAFVESVHQHTEATHELIIVDNGSEPNAAHYAERAADTAVMNATNLGFARGMNQGLEAASGEWIAFCNNDTVLPSGWDRQLLETARAHPAAGIVVPALTEARNHATVRSAPGDDIEALDPFSAPPAAVLYLMPRKVVEDLGAWGEEYAVASGEDVDLAFKVWVNGLDIVYDQRVLVEHVGKASASKLDDWQTLWAANRQRFIEKWTSDAPVPRLEQCDPDEFRRRRRTAASVASWMEQYFVARDRPAKAVARSEAAAAAGRVKGRAIEGWHQVWPHLPPGLADRIRRVGRRIIG